jgi:hypothetical protein
VCPLNSAVPRMAMLAALVIIIVNIIIMIIIAVGRACNRWADAGPGPWVEPFAPVFGLENGPPPPRGWVGPMWRR